MNKVFSWENFPRLVEIIHCEREREREEKEEHQLNFNKDDGRHALTISASACPGFQQ